MSLAAEARIIRRETRRYPGDHPTRLGLYFHRIQDVRQESRSACLAYGFLRGHTYQQLEARSYTRPDWKRVQTLVEKYGEGDSRERMQRFAAWKDEALEHAKIVPT